VSGPPERDPDEPPVVDLLALHMRDWRRKDIARRRREFRQRVAGAIIGALLVVGVAWGVHHQLSGGDGQPTALAGASSPEAAAPVRVDIGPAPADPAGSAVDPGGVADAADDSGSLLDQQRAGGQVPAAGAASTAAGGRPVVWVQAGHTDPREPGYRDQTGASASPFGSEIGFTSNLAPKVVARLRAAGVDARRTPGEVTPLGAGGAVFISLHNDTPEGAAAIGHAITGANENYYHGEGSGTASPTPYSDSAPHRPATTVSGAVESRSLDLANRLATRYRAIFTSANGARSRFTGVQPRTGNPRMMRYYGYYRTRTGARVLIECGAGGTDDAFLAKTDLIAGAVSRGVVDYLRGRGLLAR
jgi:hypothetical protein